MHERMERFWRSLAVTLGKRAGLVSVIGLLITVALGAGITQLEFTSSQDAYLNKTDRVFKNNVAYQKLFGGEAMLTVITMDTGHTVDELLTDRNRAKLTTVGKKLSADERDILGAITPVDALVLSNNLVTSKSCDPTQSIAGKAILGAQSRAPVADQAIRFADAAKTLARVAKVPCAAADDRESRLGEVPAGRQPGQDPEGAPAVLPGRAAHVDHHAVAGQRLDRAGGPRCRPHVCRREVAPFPSCDDRDGGCRGPAEGHQRLSPGRHAVPRWRRGRDHDGDPARALRRAVAAPAARHRGHRCHLGLRTGRLSRDSSHGGHYQRLTGDARYRHRLRDPDARAASRRRS